MRLFRRLATKDHAEVCPVSREVMFQPLSGSLQPGIRFLCNPIPASPTVHLAAHLPMGQRYGLTTFPTYHTIGLGPAFSPEVCVTTYPHIPQRYPTSYLLVHAHKQLRHGHPYGVYQQFTCVAHTNQPSALTRFCSEPLRSPSRRGRTQWGLHC